MAYDDMEVVMYKILRYLYDQLKAGKQADSKMIRAEGDLFVINERYWKWILSEMKTHDWIRGITIVQNGKGDFYVDKLENIEITMDGAFFLKDDKYMKEVCEELTGIRRS
ncbi:MAG: YjcQ family protein [Clostridiales bacterium]|nr:YjcQ family protein [Clostridiales bacterium]MCI7413514.1 YjcQ family protein [Clostridiales bacterium]